MRKNEFNRRTGGKYRADSARNARYAFLSASGRREGDDSGHSFRELAESSARTRARHTNSRLTAKSSNQTSRSTSTKSKKKKAPKWYAVVRGYVPGVYSNWDEAWHRPMATRTAGHISLTPGRKQSRCSCDGTRAGNSTRTPQQWRRGAKQSGLSLINS